MELLVKCRRPKSALDFAVELLIVQKQKLRVQGDVECVVEKQKVDDSIPLLKKIVASDCVYYGMSVKE